ncbi:sigma factor-like helix-turn-helix DNA-binding protein [Streptomyces sp. NPDC098101]|uniref:sigma factor-like helix-turn-helix DNA-binding protein n=1 Tax=Streptomyces sp. NPDC098101 TaxID=3366096 RepID=UPI0037F1F496
MTIGAGTDGGDRAGEDASSDRRPVGPEEVEELLYAYAPELLSSLVRRFGSFGFREGESALQEVFAEALREWPVKGAPDYEPSWLITAAINLMLVRAREAEARVRGEEAALAVPNRDFLRRFAHDAPKGAWKGTLSLLLLCCHPDLPRSARTALVLRAVGGLPAARVAAFFDLPEETLERYVARAKATIVEGGWSRALPEGEERAARLAEVRHVLRLVHDRGYAAEAARLTRLLDRLAPDGGTAERPAPAPREGERPRR